MKKFEIWFRRSGKHESKILMADNILSVLYKAALDGDIIFQAITSVSEMGL